MIAQLPKGVNIFFTREDNIKCIYDKEILFDFFKKINELTLTFKNLQIEEKWKHLQNVFCMLNDSELTQKNFLMYHTYGRDEVNNIELNDTAIIMQGPIHKDKNFTLETLKLYRSIYPYVPIVLSTWKNDIEEANKIFIEQCQDLNIVILVNDVPEGPDWQNVNRQLTTTRNGLELIVKYFKNVRYALKTRTDQRINMSDFLLYFRNLLKIYPVADTLEARLVFLSCGYIWHERPFYICDYLAFGTINDMRKLYALRDLNVQEPLDFTRTAESYIIRTFIKQYIGAIDNSKESFCYYLFLKKYAIMSDLTALRIEWPKYLVANHKVWGFISMDHAKWLNYCYCDNPGIKMNCKVNDNLNIDIIF